eukprot:1194656-Prymnesium_polylepis.1
MRAVPARSGLCRLEADAARRDSGPQSEARRVGVGLKSSRDRVQGERRPAQELAAAVGLDNGRQPQG